MEKLSCFGVSRNCFYYLRRCRVENVMKSIIAWVSLLYFCFKGDGLAWKPLFPSAKPEGIFLSKAKKGRGTVNFGHGGFHPPVSPCWEGGKSGCCLAVTQHRSSKAAKQNYLLILHAPCDISGSCSKKRWNHPNTTFMCLEPASAIGMATWLV